jgi:hypothetical protein
MDVPAIMIAAGAEIAGAPRALLKVYVSALLRLMRFH